MAASKDSTTIIMARELGLGRLDQKELANRTRRFNRSLVDRKDLTLTVANAFWVDTSETLQPELASWARAYYDASIRTIPLHSKTIGKTLNAWADSATRGRIKRIRDKPFADSVKAVLTNAGLPQGQLAHAVRDQADERRALHDGQRRSTEGSHDARRREARVSS
jgi:serine protease inhibitor